jgi:hypothetical protein
MFSPALKSITRFNPSDVAASSVITSKIAGDLNEVGSVMWLEMWTAHVVNIGKQIITVRAGVGTRFVG